MDLQPMTTSYCRHSPFLSRTGNVLHAFLSPRSDLEVSLVQWQEKAGWDVPALYLDIRGGTPVRA